jgi:hypothetical protein
MTVNYQSFAWRGLSEQRRRSQVINIQVDASQQLKILHESSARKLKNVFFENFLFVTQTIVDYFDTDTND